MALIGESCRKLRERSGMTQYALASAADVSRDTIAKLETGGLRNTSVDTLEKIASALGATLDDLLHFADRLEAAQPSVDEFLASEFAQALEVTKEEESWLRQTSAVSWLGREPNSQSLYYLIEARRRANGPGA